MRYLFFIVQCYFSITQIFGQSLKIDNCDPSSFPLIKVSIYDRDPTQWTDKEITLYENNDSIINYDLTLTPTSVQREKSVMILFENNNGNQSIDQITTLKNFLVGALSYFSAKDEFYFTEFNWTRSNGKALDYSQIHKGDKTEIIELVKNLKQVTTVNKSHESSELNTALVEALDYLSQQPDDGKRDKIILVLSAEFSNIYNSNNNPEAIIVSSKSKNIPIYSIRYPKVSEKYTLEKVCNDTYGEHFKINLAQNIKAQSAVYKKIIDNISVRAAGNQYLISYMSQKKVGDGLIKIKLKKKNDSLILETVFSAPSYLQYILLERTRFFIALSIALLILSALFTLYLRQIKRKKTEQKRIMDLQEQAKQELDKQKENLERLETNHRLQQENEVRDRKKRETELAFYASENRYKRLSRHPFLISQEGIEYPVTYITYIGRNRQDGCTICIEDPTISRKHAGIFFEHTGNGELPIDNEKFYFIDLSSANGSFVNGLKVTHPIQLNNGDVLQIGRHKLTFRF
jgi:hypothetical protein